MPINCSDDQRTLRPSEIHMTSLVQQEMAIPIQQPNSKRLYQLWKGNNRFLCGGRLIFGPEVTSVFATTALIAGPVVAFCIQVSVKILKYETSDKHDQGPILGFPVLVVSIVALILDLLFLFMTSSRDPGIVPRNTRPPEEDEAFNMATPSVEWISARTPHLRLPRTKDVIVNGFTIKVKYCNTCMLYRPPRASHCSVCDNCVQKFDHHCPWVGQCIGLRNYRFFFLFISTTMFLCIYVFAFSWLNIISERKHYHKSIWKSMTGEILSLVLIVYTFVSLWFVGGLTIFHLYLISTSQTTYENFRYHYEKRDNPYNKGVLGNFVDLFFSKIPPSLNNFRSWVVEDTIEIGPYTLNLAPKQKIDIEMGNEPALHNNSNIPSILQNLDYSFSDDTDIKDRREEDLSGPFDFPVGNETSSQGSVSFTQTCQGKEPTSDRNANESDGMAVNERDTDGCSSNGKSTHIGHDTRHQD